MSTATNGARPAALAPAADAARTRALVIAALGVVYGDIGTSPLYAVRECFGRANGIGPTPDNVYGVLSLILWSLVLLISAKYLVWVLRADNNGEGGILALMALVRPRNGRRGHLTLVALGVFGAALLYGDGMVTPAISVLSAVEGLSVRAHEFTPFIVPIAVVILLALFAGQRYGTHRVGAVFGPITILWLVTIGALGLAAILRHPSILRAVNPLYGARFFARNGWSGFVTLGSVFLAVTGGEALYADMGHFGRRPIRLAWFSIVLPMLVLNYFGQGAIVLADPTTADHPFYALVPAVALYPMVVLATAATIIASQAVISGAFSATRQAIQLGYSPRLEIRYTSPSEAGQIYMPQVNVFLMVATIGLVIGFGSSSRLAGAYGVAVTTTMVITTMLAFVVSRERWGWSVLRAAATAGVFLAIDLAFFAANLLKIPSGGWFPLLVAIAIYTVMSTWHHGREVLHTRRDRASLPVETFIAELTRHPPTRVPGTAVFMTLHPTGVPPMLLHNLKHNKVLHEQVILLTVLTASVPRIGADERVTIERLGSGIVRVTARYGFMQTPNVLEIFARTAEHGLVVHQHDTTYFLGRELPIAGPRGAMSAWRARLFAVLARNAGRAPDFFHVPADRVFEIGGYVEV